MVEGLTYIEGCSVFLCPQFLSLFSCRKSTGFAGRHRGVEQW